MSTFRFNPLVSACRKIYLLGSFALNMKTLLLKYFDLWKQLKKAKIDFISIAIKFFSKLLNQPVGKAKKLKVKSFQIRQIWFTLIYLLFRFWELSFEHIFDEIDLNLTNFDVPDFLIRGRVDQMRCRQKSRFRIFFNQAVEFYV